MTIKPKVPTCAGSHAALLDYCTVRVRALAQRTPLCPWTLYEDIQDALSQARRLRQSYQLQTRLPR